MMEQALRGLKYVTHEDLANALAALHKMPRCVRALSSSSLGHSRA